MRTIRMIAVASAATLCLGLAACGQGDDAETASPASTGMATPTAMAPSSATATAAEFGPGCAAVPADPANAGSFQAMAQVPVATAASGNPLLTTLVTAVKEAALVDSLNSAPALTVFAPVDAAFAKIPKADLDKVLADKKQLTDVLTYHAVSGKLAPADLAGTHKTLQGGELTVAGSGESFTVNGNAAVVCGNVQTANATVYIIDTVLMPKS
ncbi:putative surface protein with fasciclin (FAS1) repeats [Catenuloplanes nepalensis]|uniref:Surface protein with fasciclin (FAS1) repeats n=1 Tax=Catenuloplanes nepalensis TaxID=587533 RepID=A0ABT9MRI1_9ACTN|nr:fasciclin domain-containing protein [Catenuloplanes nepalensis]MDP9793906.1 putative surface protein with fasciclin (FAS1) repeats [Catenuloplanes nepalensis]